MKIERRFAVTVVLSGLLAAGPTDLWALSSRGGPGDAVPPGTEKTLKQEAAERLEDAGLSRAEASERAGRLSRAEAWHVAREAPEIRRGGDALVTVLAIVAIVAVIWLVVEHRHGHPHL